MKKLITFILVLSLVLGLGTVVMADQLEDQSTVTINKDLTATGGTNPAETFSFAIEKGTGERDGVTFSAPDFKDDTFTISVNQGETTGTANITLPQFNQVGVYTYPISETAGDTAGMRYDGTAKNLVITVINNPDYDNEDEESLEFLRVVTMTSEDEQGNPIKVETFQNSFEAGSLTVNKVVTGNYGDPNDEFEVTVTLTPKEGKVLKAEPIEAEGGNKTVNSDGSVTIVYTVKDESEYTITNIPYDVNYTVVESESEYEVSYTNASGEIDATSIETTITNERNIGIETGINLDSMPYLIILAVAIGGLAVFMVRRRMVINE